MLQGNILVCYATSVLIHINLLSSAEMCDSLFRNDENESSLAYTDFFVFFLLGLYPELRLRLSSSVEALRQNRASVVTDFDVS